MVMNRSGLENSPFPITLQCTFPPPGKTDSFLKLLDLLSRRGFYGIELNLEDLRSISPHRLTGLLDSFGLKLTYLATGVFARAHGYSLSTSDPHARQSAIDGCRENLYYASECGCGIIIGFMKNNPLTDTCSPEFYLEESLRELTPLAGSLHVPILLEATNHYESRVANSLAQTLEIVQSTDPDVLSVLPDTYHMNIEESDPFRALERCRGHFPNLHISDNNRLFPGLGCIQFPRYIQKLEELHYHGTLGIEGNLKYGYERDLEIASSYLSGILNRLIPV